MSLPQRKTRPQRQKVRPRDDKIAESLYHDKRHKSDSLRLVLEVHQADSVVDKAPGVAWGPFVKGQEHLGGVEAAVVVEVEEEHDHGEEGLHGA